MKLPYNGSGQKELWGSYNSNKAKPSSADAEDVNPAAGHCNPPCRPPRIHTHTNLIGPQHVTQLLQNTGRPPLFTFKMTGMVSK